jgi:hypothetical protein
MYEILKDNFLKKLFIQDVKNSLINDADSVSRKD